MRTLDDATIIGNVIGQAIGRSIVHSLCRQHTHTRANNTQRLGQPTLGGVHMQHLCISLTRCELCEWCVICGCRFVPIMPHIFRLWRNEVRKVYQLRALHALLYTGLYLSICYLYIFVGHTTDIFYSMAD